MHNLYKQSSQGQILWLTKVGDILNLFSIIQVMILKTLPIPVGPGFTWSFDGIFYAI